MSRSSIFREKLLGVNNIKLVFSTFNDNLFALTQEYILVYFHIYFINEIT